MSGSFFVEQTVMYSLYELHGVRFQFPEVWEVNEDKTEKQISITVSTPGTSFWMLTLFLDGASEDQLIESALDAFRDEYEELDIYPVEERVCGRGSLARDLEFVCLELLNSAFLRAVQTEHFSALILYQGTDHELKETRAELEKISQSLEFDGDRFDDSE